MVLMVFLKLLQKKEMETLRRMIVEYFPHHHLYK